MVEYHTFYENQKTIELTLNWQNYYRSSLSRSDINHCYEVTYLSEHSSYSEIGFSCVYQTRTFVSFYQNQGLMRKINDIEKDDVYYDCNITADKGETVQVCYNSITHMFHLIKGEQKCSQEISFPNPDTWFAYLDHANYIPEDTVSVNLGTKSFVNPMPIGFQPWFVQIKTCSHYLTLHPSSFVFIYLLSL